MVGAYAPIGLPVDGHRVLTRESADSDPSPSSLTRRIARLWKKAVFAACASCLLGAVAHADSFGRFGYRPLADLPDFIVDPTGIRVRAPGSDQLLFPHPSKLFRPTQTSSTSQTVALDGGPGAPSAVRCSLIGASVDLYYSQGVELHLKADEPPFLSWKDGSVGPDVASPNSSWLLLSYPSEKSPIVFGFSGQRASFVMTGKAGDWKLSSPGFSGWLRLLLPIGVQTAKTTDAASLGRLSSEVARESDRWSSPTPKVERVKISADDLGVDAEWQFDGPGAVAPPSVTLAQIGGYPITILSPHHSLPGYTNGGPLEAADGNTLKVHFPCRRIGLGRALGVGPYIEDPIASVSPNDIPSIVELAMDAMLAYRDPALAKLADDTSTRYLGDTVYAAEPFTGQQLPFDDHGSGIDLAAAHALLFQATSDAVGSTEPNALFDSVSCCRDWWSWKIWADAPATSARATALAAVAGALSQEPTARLMGATLEAGFDAQRGLNVWRRRLGLPQGDSVSLNPLPELRAGIFALNRPGISPSPFFALLQSPLRVGVGGGVELKKDGGGYQLIWPAFDSKPSVITFLEPAKMEFSASENIHRLTVDASSRLLSLFYVPIGGGTCIARLSLPADFPAIPAQVPPPTYSESP